MSDPSVLETLGYDEIQTCYYARDDVDVSALILSSIQRAARVRGVDLDVPSDELDAQRDAIIDEGVYGADLTLGTPLNTRAEWRIVDGQLRVTFDGIKIDQIDWS